MHWAVDGGAPAGTKSRANCTVAGRRRPQATLGEGGPVGRQRARLELHSSRANCTVAGRRRPQATLGEGGPVGRQRARLELHSSRANCTIAGRRRPQATLGEGGPCGRMWASEGALGEGRPSGHACPPVRPGPPPPPSSTSPASPTGRPAQELRIPPGTRVMARGPPGRAQNVRHKSYGPTQMTQPAARRKTYGRRKPHAPSGPPSARRATVFVTGHTSHNPHSQNSHNSCTHALFHRHPTCSCPMPSESNEMGSRIGNTAGWTAFGQGQPGPARRSNWAGPGRKSAQRGAVDLAGLHAECGRSEGEAAE